MNETIVFDQHQKRLSPLALVEAERGEDGRKWSLRSGRQRFGRGDENEIVLDDPTISRNHGVVEYATEGRVVVYDTASRNGISLKGSKRPVIELKVGEEIQIGSVYLKLISQSLVRPRGKSRSIPLVALMVLLSCLVFIPAPRPLPASSTEVIEVEVKPPPFSYPRRTILQMEKEETR